MHRYWLSTSFTNNLLNLCIVKRPNRFTMAAIPMSRTISITAKLEQRRRPSYKSLLFWIKGYLN